MTLIELLVIIAILGVIAAVVALNVGDFFGKGTIEPPVNMTLFTEWAAFPINSLNQSQLEFMFAYCMQYAIVVSNTSGLPFTINEVYVDMAQLYQNQIIINELREVKQ